MKIKDFTEYIKESNKDKIILIHTTTPSIAEKIKVDGFQPSSFINYKYYSEMGIDGIYFYDNLRQTQIYAWYLQSKTKSNKVALIKVEVPKWTVLNNEKIEDGFFIPSKYLNMVEIKDITFKNPSDIY